MRDIHIVTDSCARFVNPQLIQQDPVTIVPNKIVIGGKTYREGIDLGAEEALQLIAVQPTPPTVTSPTTEEYLEVYQQLARTNSTIVSIHASRELFPSWQNAKIAAQQLAGNCQIEVVDSQTLCAAQGMLVRLATKVIQQEESLEAVIRLIRGAVDRVYSVYYVEKLDYLLHNNIMSAPHTVLGAMLGIKPFLTIEEGRIVLVEKVKTRNQAIDQLVEFLVEFTDIEDIAILQHKAHMSEQTRLIQDRLSLEFPGRHFPFTVYAASLAALIGADATGLVVLEKESEDFDDDL
jgi:DegV family protein with EDD domain